ncbi:hypothetical protein ONZ45_g2563 [Pleurotus djamor]|nr:hypothetical protein ONZ45_g2563 [Pleurotus djamor]
MASSSSSHQHQLFLTPAYISSSRKHDKENANPRTTTDKDDQDSPKNFRGYGRRVARLVDVQDSLDHIVNAGITHDISDSDDEGDEGDEEGDVEEDKDGTFDDIKDGKISVNADQFPRFLYPYGHEMLGKSGLRAELLKGYLLIRSDFHRDVPFTLTPDSSFFVAARLH